LLSGRFAHKSFPNAFAPQNDAIGPGGSLATQQFGRW
jgi:hypothetical protein